MENEPITLKEVQLRLRTPAHVLIHLCEKGVITPDFADTSGRGKRREFSNRNVYEFAVALAMRRSDLPIAKAAFVVRLLRSFARATGKLLPGFELPGFLLEREGELALHLYDGRVLLFRASGASLRKPLLLSSDISAAASPGARPRVERLDDLPRQYEVKVEIDLTQIARNLGK